MPPETEEQLLAKIADTLNSLLVMFPTEKDWENWQIFDKHITNKEDLQTYCDLPADELDEAWDAYLLFSPLLASWSYAHLQETAQRARLAAEKYQGNIAHPERKLHLVLPQPKDG